MELATMPFIVLVVYFVIYCLKLWVLKTNEARKSIPPIAAALGCGIAVAIYFFAPELIGFENIIDCCTTGIGSGLAAVGCNQVIKQHQKFKNPTSNIVVEEELPVEEKNDAADDDRVGG